MTNPIDSITEDLEHLTEYPGHYLGEAAGGTALTAPSALLGGEGALLAQGARSAIPDDVIDLPSPTRTVENSTSIPLADVPARHTPIPDLTPPPLPPDSPLFDGYDPIPLGPDFTNPDGSLIYPDDSLPSKPYAIPGTVVDHVDIPQGTVIDRFGSEFGSWLSPDETPFAERALPPESAAKPYHRYVVAEPSSLPPGFRIEQSGVAPWFNQPGGGVQYRIIGPDGSNAPVRALLRSGYLEELHE
ncbi:TNT domain-containing protein [Mycolicibacterium sp. XJ2]